MSKVEEMLSLKKSEMDKLEVPDELETRLRKALESKSLNKKRKRSFAVKAAVLLIAFMLAAYNIDTLAYYGRELLGFDNIMSGTLKELNKMGMGQPVEKSYTFSNGVKVTLNGVMIDDNQLLAFYTIEDPKGNVDELNFNSMHMKGAFGWHKPESAEGMSSEDGSIIKWVGRFEPPYAFEKQLTWLFEINSEGRREEGKITFVLDRDKAMGHTLKIRLNKTIELNENKIRIDSITASPTITIVRGTMKTIAELARDQIRGERLYSPEIDIRLLADGKEVQQLGTGSSTDLKGMTFEVRYDALPRDIEKLQLHLVSFTGEHEVNQRISLDKDLKSKTIQINGQDIIIEKVYENKGETYVTITTEESVVLRRVYLIADGKKAELEDTSESRIDKKEEGKITKTRTLRFKTVGENLQLEVQRITYKEAYDEYIDIPIE